jgi:two-component system cell cycle response regulator DivK
MDKKALILVADDNSECRRLLVWILELHGFRTISATCGLEAVESAIAFQPRLVLMDLNMPGMDGLEATQAIHAHPRGRNIPVAAVSSYCVDPGFVSALKGRFIACLGKPWEEEALLQTVTKVLAGAVKHTRVFSTPEKLDQRVSRPGITPQSAESGDHVWTPKEFATLLGAARTPKQRGPYKKKSANVN